MKKNNKNSKNKIPKFSVGGQTLSSAAAGAGAGASVGSIVPGIGTAIGAGAGAIIGGVSGYLNASEDEEAKDKEINDQKAIAAENKFQANYKPQYSNGYYAMATGGIMPNTNAMVDNNEVVQTNGPVNQLAQSTGGGQFSQLSNNTAVVNGNNPNQTDGVQAQIEPGSRIFSDKIKVSGNKTYADIANKISKEKAIYERILDNENSSQLQKKTAKKMIEKIDEKLDALFQQQEESKPQPKQEEVLNQQEVEPTMAYGGTVPKYSGGNGEPGIIAPYKQRSMLSAENPDLPYTDPIYTYQPTYLKPGFVRSTENSTGEIITQFPQSQITNNPGDINIYGEQSPIFSPPSNIPNNNISGVNYANTIPLSGKTSSYPNQPGTPATREGYKRDEYGHEYKVNALGLSDWQTEKGTYRIVGALAPLVNIGRGLFEKADLLDPNAYGTNARITAPKMDVEPQVSEVRNAARANRNALGSLGQQAFLTGMNSVNATSDRSIAGIYSNKHNVDAENQMKADMYNAEANKADRENRLKIEEINRAAKGAKDNMLMTGLSQASEYGQGLFRDESFNRSMQGVNSNYYYDPITGKWIIKDSSQKGNVSQEGYVYGNNDKLSGASEKTDEGKKSTSANTFDYKTATSSVSAKAKDNEIFGGKNGVWAKHINGNKDYNEYIKTKLKSKGITKYSNLTWGQIKKYLD